MRTAQETIMHVLFTDYRTREKSWKQNKQKSTQFYDQSYGLHKLFARVHESSLHGLPCRDRYPLMALTADLMRIKLILILIQEITWLYGSFLFADSRSARCLYATVVSLLIPPKIDLVTKECTRGHLVYGHQICRGPEAPEWREPGWLPKICGWIGWALNGVLCVPDSSNSWDHVGQIHQHFFHNSYKNVARSEMNQHASL
jgi:hypothetical protein